MVVWNRQAEDLKDSVNTPASPQGPQAPAVVMTPEPVAVKPTVAVPQSDEFAADDPISQFAAWSARYLAASADERRTMEAEGIALATARRAVLKELIQADPREALAKAVPMVVRQQLPSSILALLEERVSGTCGLEVLAVSPDSDPSEPIYRHIAPFTRISGNSRAPPHVHYILTTRRISRFL